ncbi:MAG TPA: site-2 protease family protein [Holophaga sp.]|nr:site-2 protease family protein [Holophaga sp.]
MFDHVSIPTILISYVALLFSLCVHEASHAAAAYLLDDDTAARMGRMTLNPAAHVDLVGTVIFPLLGLFFGGFFIGWAKPVPFDPSRLTRRLRLKVSAALISFAGPASNLLQSVLFLVITCFVIKWVAPGTLFRERLFAAAFSGPEELAAAGARPALILILGLGGALVRLNVLLAAFNILPIGPLDGAGVLGGFLPDRLQYKYTRLRYHPYTWMALMLIMISGLGVYLFAPIQHVTYLLLSPIADLILGP